MHVDDLREKQRAGATADLFALVMACRRKFLNAARLLELRSPAIDRLHAMGAETAVDVWPLLRPFEVLTERYIAAFFTPQDALFPNPGDGQDVRWSRYFHHVLLPHLLQNDELVRNVLRAVRALPCNDSQAAAGTLAQLFSEMTLPETAPAWAPEDILDN